MQSDATNLTQTKSPKLTQTDPNPENGARLIFLVLVEDTPQSDMYTLDIQTGIATVLFETPDRENSASLSPDGTLIAYTSDKTGDLAIYVRSFADLGPEVQVSDGVGRVPVWSRDGSRIFYRVLDGSFMAAEVRAEPRLEVLGRSLLFNGAPYWVGGEFTAYDVDPDGRFLLIRQRDPETEASDSLRVIVNFSEMLKRLAPPGGR